MGKTARRTWQLAESRLARFFGAQRKVLSGSSGRPDDNSCSDSTHPTLFLEGKLKASHATRTLHDATRALAKREGKIPVLGLFDKNRPGFLIVVHSDDWDKVVAEYQKTR